MPFLSRYRSFFRFLKQTTNKTREITRKPIDRELLDYCSDISERNSEELCIHGWFFSKIDNLGTKNKYKIFRKKIKLLDFRTEDLKKLHSNPTLLGVKVQSKRDKRLCCLK